jgi:hypothetical protein
VGPTGTLRWCKTERIAHPGAAEPARAHAPTPFSAWGEDAKPNATRSMRQLRPQSGREPLSQLAVKNGRFRPGQKRLGFVGSYRREEPLAAYHQGFHRLPSLQRLAPHKAELEPASATAWPLIKAPINADIG